MANDNPLINQMPIRDNAAASRSRAADSIRRMGSFRGTSPQALKAAGPALIQQTGTSTAQQVGAQDTRETAEAAKKTITDAGRDFETSQIDESQRQLIAQQQHQKKLREQKKQLSLFGEDIENKLFNDKLDFQKEEKEDEYHKMRRSMDYLVDKARRDKGAQEHLAYLAQEIQKEELFAENAFLAASELERRQAQAMNTAEDVKAMRYIHQKKVEAAKRAARAKKKAGVFRNAVNAAVFATGAVLTATGVGAPVGTTMMVTSGTALARDNLGQ